jgi:CheY-like chemotaxis protein
MRADGERSLDGLRIVVVEDDALSLEVLCQALEYYGASVAGASGVPEARALLARGIPDVVLTDIHLGSDTGVALLEWLRTRPQRAVAELPVVAITAYPTPPDSEMPRAFDAWLTKPLMMELVRDAILRVASARSQRRAAGL